MVLMHVELFMKAPILSFELCARNINDLNDQVKKEHIPSNVSTLRLQTEMCEFGKSYNAWYDQATGQLWRSFQKATPMVDLLCIGLHQNMIHICLGKPWKSEYLPT